MNIHHLELFYYVARYRGISQAVRNMPYGIQQPAVSGQIIQLEDDLGTPLFQRRPFKLTSAGEELYQFIAPFFDGVADVAERIRGGASHLIRLAASHVILRDHLPTIMRHLKGRYPAVKFHLQEGVQPMIEEWFERQEIDIGITAVVGRPRPGIQVHPLIRLPLILLVPDPAPYHHANDILELDRIPETLISLPANEAATKIFQRELARRKRAWPLGMEVNSLDLIDTYVQGGFGLGLSVGIPNRPAPAGLRILPLSDFPEVEIAAFYRGPLSPPEKALITELENRAAKVAGRKKSSRRSS